MWGKEKSEWFLHYIQVLEKYFNVRFYDCRELANIPGNKLSDTKLHTQFVNGGIERAVEKLLQIENEAFVVLGFSVGGYIAWKACLSGFKTQYLFAVSSTRLRYETEKPPVRFELFYGENDLFKPEKKWFQQMKIKENSYPNEEHELYQKKEIAEDICERIIEQIKPNRSG